MGLQLHCIPVLQYLDVSGPCLHATMCHRARDYIASFCWVFQHIAFTGATSPATAVNTSQQNLVQALHAASAPGPSQLQNLSATFQGAMAPGPDHFVLGNPIGLPTAVETCDLPAQVAGGQDTPISR